MEEARYRALFLAMFMLMLMIGGKCSYLRAKLAHLVGHLPPTTLLYFRKLFLGRFLATLTTGHYTARHRMPARFVFDVLALLVGFSVGLIAAEIYADKCVYL